MLSDGGRKWTGFSELRIKMNARDGRCRRHLPCLFIVHFMGEADHFLFDLKDTRVNSNHIASVQFTSIRDILLDRSHPSMVFTEKGWGQSQEGEQVPGGSVRTQDTVKKWVRAFPMLPLKRHLYTCIFPTLRSF
jgi:hypothetical protein